MTFAQPGLALKVVERPDLRAFAAMAMQTPIDMLPSEPRELGEAFAAESLRIGLHAAYQDQVPVHQLQLRSWLQRKLEAFLPELSNAGHYEAIAQMIMAKPGPISFLGDVLVLENGFLAPGPLRAIPIGDQDHVLIGGTPAAALGPICKDNIRFAGISRHVVGINARQIAEAGLPVLDRPPSSTLRAGAVFDASGVLREALRGVRGKWVPRNDWEGYVGNDGGRGFTFTRDPLGRRARRPIELEFEGLAISLWRERRGQEGERHWLRVRKGARQESVPIARREHAQVCLAIDKLSGQPRLAELEPASLGKVRLSLPMKASGDLYRWIRLVGGRSVMTSGDHHVYEIPARTAAFTHALVQATGIRVRQGGQ